MNNYRFQEVLCPFCKKSYMTRIYNEYDVTVYHDDNTINGWKDNCPKCCSEVFVVENERNGIDISN